MFKHINSLFLGVKIFNGEGVHFFVREPSLLQMSKASASGLDPEVHHTLVLPINSLIALAYRPID